MRISISVTNYDGADLREIARAAGDAGVDTLWVTDHLIQADPHASPDGAMLEAYTALGYLAAVSERVRLGAMVSPVTFREPALLVKAVTTLDVLSGGRAWLGIGAGYQQDEAAALGLPLPPAGDRFERLGETLRIALAMWAGDQQPIHGAHYQLAHPICYPPPATRPHPPILIGGTGERHTLRLVAQYGDACNLFDIPDGGRTVRHKLDVLAQHCERPAGPTRTSRRPSARGSTRPPGRGLSQINVPGSPRSASAMPWSSPAGPGHLRRSPCSPARRASNPRRGGAGSRHGPASG